MSSLPTEPDAAEAVRIGLGQTALVVNRFPTGNHHFVYDVYTDHNEWVVARLALPSQREFLAGAVYWSNQLRPKGIPLPKILAANLDSIKSPFPFLILERFPGTDLEEVYEDLSSDDRRRLASEMVRLHSIVSQLPHGPGFGYLTSYENKPTQTQWSETVQASLTRSRARIREAKRVNESCVDEIEALLPSLQAYFNSIQPIPFLPDITTKNVIIDKNRLSGIVDVDTLCFGDPLLTVALTRTALWSEKRDLDYVECWTELLQLQPEQQRALDFYTAQCVVDFMSELGHAFNRAKPAKIDTKRLARLQAMHAELVKSLRG